MINLVAGFQSSIQIKDKNDEILYQRQCDSEGDVRDFIQQNGKSKDGWSMLQGAIMPIRTHSLEDFSKDFFLPTLVNFSLKINTVALKIIASVFALTLDILTAPVRLFATPIRIYYNYKHPESEHPIKNLINGRDDDVVSLCYEVQNVQINDEAPDEEGNTFQNAIKSTVKGTIEIVLKRIPGGIHHSSSENKVDAIYSAINGEWTLDSCQRRSSAFSSYAC